MMSTVETFEFEDDAPQPRKPDLLAWLLVAATALIGWYALFRLMRRLGYPELAVAGGLALLAVYAVSAVAAWLPDVLGKSLQRRIQASAAIFIVTTVLIAKQFYITLMPTALAEPISLHTLEHDLKAHAGETLEVRGVVTWFLEGSPHPTEPGRPRISSAVIEDGVGSVRIAYDHEDGDFVPTVGDKVVAAGFVAMPKKGRMDALYQLKYGRPMNCFLATEMGRTGNLSGTLPLCASCLRAKWGDPIRCDTCRTKLKTMIAATGD